jgi:thiol:disulfide interchange protein DsbD
MEATKKAFGFILLATALWLISPFIADAVQMGAWALLLIIPAVLMRGFSPLAKNAKGWQRLRKFIAIAMLIIGAVLMAGAFSDSKDLLQVFSRLLSGGQTGTAKHLPFERVGSLAELDTRISASGKPVTLDFYADWCVSCKEMVRFTFSDARVQQKLAGWTLLQADVTANSDADKALLARFKLFGPPGIIFFDRQGKEINGVRVIGFQNADEFMDTLTRLR